MCHLFAGLPFSLPSPICYFPLNSVNVLLFNFHGFSDAHQISCYPPLALNPHCSLSVTHTSLVGFFFLFFSCRASRNTAAVAAAAAVVLLQSDRAGRFGHADGIRRNGMMGNDVREKRKLVEAFPGVSGDVSVKFSVFGHSKMKTKTSTKQKCSEFSLLSWKMEADKLTAASFVCHSKP